MSCLMLTSPAAHTWACLPFRTTLTSHLSSTENDTLAPYYKVCFVVTQVRFVLDLLDVIDY